jgi:DNA-binding NtrC family response regulator
LAEGRLLELSDLVLDDRNREQAAQRLGIGVRTMYSKLKKYRLED